MTTRIVYAQLQTSDFANAKTFYAQLCGWTITDDPPGAGPAYAEASADGKPVGGIMPLPAPGVPPHWLLYLDVDDLDAAVASAQRLGATVVVPPMNVAAKNVRISVLKDPAGADFALRSALSGGA